VITGQSPIECGAESIEHTREVRRNRGVPSPARSRLMRPVTSALSTISVTVSFLSSIGYRQASTVYALLRAEAILTGWSSDPETGGSARWGRWNPSKTLVDNRAGSIDLRHTFRQSNWRSERKQRMRMMGGEGRDKCCRGSSDHRRSGPRYRSR
jgi:hypothetical protein